ncbi:MAG TPA: hypothetical protein VFI37_09230 [Gaiellaceae bacterium]|jgi:hypothetical protein|nr:hypothetical protein [Gaiellaceae bacterium]
MGREERLARNEVLFREVNERIKDVSELTGTLDGGPEFLCVCADAGCIERIGLSLGEYETLRADPRRFVVLRGHETDVERVVADRGTHLTPERRQG